MLAAFPRDEDAFQAAIVIPERVGTLPAHSGVAPAVRLGVCSSLAGGADSGRPVVEAAATQLAALAQPNQVLFAWPEERRTGHFLGAGMPVRRLPHLSIAVAAARLDVFEVDWRRNDALPASLRLAGLLGGDSRLLIDYRGREVLLHEGAPRLTIGRDPGCGLVLQDGRASREHGRFEQRGGSFVYIDHSRNGTFVTLDGGDEILLHHREQILAGWGRLSFGAPIRSSTADQATFLLPHWGTGSGGD